MIVGMGGTADFLRHRSKELRANMTPAERIVWAELRREATGARFRRQARIGPAIADFLCPALRLVIEIDGPIHEDTRQHDENRDIWMSQRGYVVLRFTNDEVESRTTMVVNRIRSTIAQLSR